MNVGSILTQVLGLLLWGFCVGCQEEKPVGYYEHESGFSLIIPQGWNYVENVGGSSMVLWEGKRDSIAPTITIVAVDLPEEATNENFADFNFRDAAKTDGYLPMRSERIAIDGDSLPVLIYTYRQEGMWRQGMLTSIVGEDDQKKGYVINCSSKPGRIEGDKSKYRQVIETFKREG